MYNMHEYIVLYSRDMLVYLHRDTVETKTVAFYNLSEFPQRVL